MLSKSKLLKTANIYVSEDLSRKTREHRNELFKYMRFVKRRVEKRKKGDGTKRKRRGHGKKKNRRSWRKIEYFEKKGKQMKKRRVS